MGLTRDGLKQLWNNMLLKIDERVEKIDGKGLSSNDFTDEYKTKLDSIDSVTGDIAIDSVLSDESANPVENRVIKAAIDNKADAIHEHTQYLTSIPAMYITEAKLKTAIDNAIEDLQSEVASQDAAILAEAQQGIAAAQEALDTHLENDSHLSEQEVKTIIDGVIAAAADSETYNSLTKLVDYIDTHGGEAAAMAGAIDTLEDKIEVIEAKPAYVITETQVANWDAEVGAKAIAESKADAVHNHNDIYYTKEQIDAMELITIADIDEICGAIFVETNLNDAGGVTYMITSLNYEASSNTAGGVTYEIGG